MTFQTLFCQIMCPGHQNAVEIKVVKLFKHGLNAQLDVLQIIKTTGLVLRCFFSIKTSETTDSDVLPGRISLLQCWSLQVMAKVKLVFFKLNCFFDVSCMSGGAELNPKHLYFYCQGARAHMKYATGGVNREDDA